MPYDSSQRHRVIDKIKDSHFDVLVIGGGITGAGIALDAVSRGYRVALVEMQDFAAGTSSRSTKLIHGGLRYLKNLELNIVRETGLERAVAYRNAPHLVRPEKMLLPLIKGGSYGKIATSLGLWLYDVLAGVKGNDRRKMLDKSATLEKEPLLRGSGLLGSGYYAEYRTDDARFTLEVLKTATNMGAVAINYMKVNHLTYIGAKVSGVTCIDQVTGSEATIHAKYIVNATGPWVDEIREMDNSMSDKRLQLSKGVHIVVSREKLPIRQSIYFDVNDGRMIFAIPRGDTTYIGTTDTFYQGDKVVPEVTRDDVNYLLKAVNDMFEGVNLTTHNIDSHWSGLRPLIYEEGKDPSEVSRGDEVFESDSGLITIAGGKLTGYRLMAKKVVRKICDKERVTRKCKTRRIRLCGGEFAHPREVMHYADQVAEALSKRRLPINKAFYLVHNYGRQVDDMLKLIDKKKCKNIVEAEAFFCLKNEGVVKLEDFFTRRTGKTLFESPKLEDEIPLVLPIFQQTLGWDKSQATDEQQTISKARRVLY